jgi:hypothetical protein
VLAASEHVAAAADSQQRVSAGTGGYWWCHLWRESVINVLLLLL